MESLGQFLRMTLLMVTNSWPEVFLSCKYSNIYFLETYCFSENPISFCSEMYSMGSYCSSCAFICFALFFLMCLCSWSRQSYKFYWCYFYLRSMRCLSITLSKPRRRSCLLDFVIMSRWSSMDMNPLFKGCSPRSPSSL